MHCFSCLSPTKLNLFLHITHKRVDGYHQIQSVFCRTDFGDYLHFAPSERTNAQSDVHLLGAKGLGKLQDNLIIKAANALSLYARTYQLGDIYPVTITLDKRVPTGAGLGGGSSNAATTLITLNKLWQINLPTPILADIGARIGADVAFFVHNVPAAIAEGIGDKITPIALPAVRYLILMPKVHNSTKDFFNNPNLNKNCLPIDFLAATSSPTALTDALVRRFLYQLSPPFCNVFESLALASAPIYQAMSYLANLPINSTPRLTGTGSAVFLVIDDGIDDEILELWQNNAPCQAIIARGY